MNRLSATSTTGKGWAYIVRVAHPGIRTDAPDPMQLWPLDPWHLPARPLVGPLLYIALGHNRVQYVGQTRRTLQKRVREHQREIRKAQDWSHVGAIVMAPSTLADELDALELRARALLKPLMGSAWPRERRCLPASGRR